MKATRVIELDASTFFDLNMGHEEYLANAERRARRGIRRGSGERESQRDG